MEKLKIVIREPDKRELKKFQRRVVESIQVRILTDKITELRQEVNYWINKTNHLDKLSKEDYIALMKELKQMKIDSRVNQLEEELKKAYIDIKSLHSSSRKQVAEITELKVRLKEL